MRALLYLFLVMSSLNGLRAHAANRSEAPTKNESSDSDSDNEPKKRAKHGRLGLGVVIAGPTGLTAQYHYGKKKDVTASFGWGWDELHLNLDHHWNNKDLIKAKGIAINVYYGLGLRWINIEGPSKTTDYIGVRMPVGVQHIFREVPIQIFFELAPALNLSPNSFFVIDLALGARYFF